MGRIRTVKPELFTHEGLFEAEMKSGLPLRLAYIGLWTVADRAGRFQWRPRTLKLSVLPYDQEVNFSLVLDALSAAGFICRYEVDGDFYGVIPSWSKHQVINNRERESMLPEPRNSPLPIDIPERCQPSEAESVAAHVDIASATHRERVTDASSTREARVTDASSTPHRHAQGEGKGRELELEGKGCKAVAQRDSETPFDRFWSAYPNKRAKKSAQTAFRKLNPSRELLDQILGALDWQRQSLAWTKDRGAFIPHPATWLNSERWLDERPITSVTAPTDSDVRHELAKLRYSGSEVIDMEDADA